MTSPLHQYASAALGRPAEATFDRLTEDPQTAVASATASTLTRLEPLWRAWGLAPRSLPEVVARPTTHDEVGAVDLTWSGDETETAWPSLNARLLAVPGPSGSSRLAFVSSRSPRVPMLPGRVDPLLSDRLLHLSVQTFLRDLARQISGHRPVPERDGGVAEFAREPMFVHHRRALDGGSAALASRLLDDAEALAAAATATAVERAGEVLAAGRFRRVADPGVAVEPARAGELGVLKLTWTSDEDATGWPALTMNIIVEAHHRGSQLVLVSTREPGYDLSVNRVDKHQRDRIIREAGPHIADALCVHIRDDRDRTSPSAPGPSDIEDRPQPSLSAAVRG